MKPTIINGGSSALPKKKLHNPLAIFNKLFTITLTVNDPDRFKKEQDK